MIQKFYGESSPLENIYLDEFLIIALVISTLECVNCVFAFLSPHWMNPMTSLWQLAAEENLSDFLTGKRLKYVGIFSHQKNDLRYLTVIVMF